MCVHALERGVCNCHFNRWECRRCMGVRVCAVGTGVQIAISVIRASPIRVRNTP